MLPSSSSSGSAIHMPPVSAGSAVVVTNEASGIGRSPSLPLPGVCLVTDCDGQTYHGAVDCYGTMASDDMRDMFTAHRAAASAASAAVSNNNSNGSSSLLLPSPSHSALLGVTASPAASASPPASAMPGSPGHSAKKSVSQTSLDDYNPLAPSPSTSPSTTSKTLNKNNKGQDKGSTNNRDDNKTSAGREKNSSSSRQRNHSKNIAANHSSQSSSGASAAGTSASMPPPPPSLTPATLSSHLSTASAAAAAAAIAAAEAAAEIQGNDTDSHSRASLLHGLPDVFIIPPPTEVLQQQQPNNNTLNNNNDGSSASLQATEAEVAADAAVAAQNPANTLNATASATALDARTSAASTMTPSNSGTNISTRSGTDNRLRESEMKSSFSTNRINYAHFNNFNNKKSVVTTSSSSSSSSSNLIDNNDSNSNNNNSKNNYLPTTASGGEQKEESNHTNTNNNNKDHGDDIHNQQDNESPTRQTADTYVNYEQVDGFLQRCGRQLRGITLSQEELSRNRQQRHHAVAELLYPHASHVHHRDHHHHRPHSGGDTQQNSSCNDSLDDYNNKNNKENDDGLHSADGSQQQQQQIQYQQRQIRLQQKYIDQKHFADVEFWKVMTGDIDSRLVKKTDTNIRSRRQITLAENSTHGGDGTSPTGRQVVSMEEELVPPEDEREEQLLVPDGEANGERSNNSDKKSATENKSMEKGTEKSMEKEKEFIVAIEQESKEAWCVESVKMLRQRVRQRPLAPAERAVAWAFFSGASRSPRFSNSRTFYDSLLARSAPREYNDVLLRDLGRTFPNHVLFASAGGEGQRRLRRVLHAYSVLDAEVGYCQGMGFVVAVLLMHQEEHIAFATFCQMMYGKQFQMRQIFISGFPLLQTQFEVLRRLMKRFVPHLSTYLDAYGIDVPFYASQWFLTLFSYQFPLALVADIWDLFFSEGWKIIFRVALTLLKWDETRLTQLPMENLLLELKEIHEGKSPAEILQRAKALPLKGCDIVLS